MSRLPDAVAEELAGAARAPKVKGLPQRMAEAVRAYERDRYDDARRMLRRLAEEAPSAPAVRELYGLALYRMGRWRDAIQELEEFHVLTGSYDQHPVLADCNRAVGDTDRVAELWAELRVASPAGGVVAEGRLVAAGAMADGGDLQGATRLLERSERARGSSKHAGVERLRTWYALADLYERAGDIPRARDLFHRVLDHDPGLYDVAERLASLR
ncbi:MAG TPA: tetratricopeptide repeat protein [Acidimicrobiales bacterium]|nr:tetratricopeptide repeat protein [Acidimicrobiales bacterium]